MSARGPSRKVRDAKRGRRKKGLAALVVVACVVALLLWSWQGGAPKAPTVPPLGVEPAARIRLNLVDVYYGICSGAGHLLPTLAFKFEVHSEVYPLTVVLQDEEGRQLDRRVIYQGQRYVELAYYGKDAMMRDPSMSLGARVPLGPATFKLTILDKEGNMVATQALSYDYRVKANWYYDFTPLGGNEYMVTRWVVVENLGEHLAAYPIYAEGVRVTFDVCGAWAVVPIMQPIAVFARPHSASVVFEIRELVAFESEGELYVAWPSPFGSEVAVPVASNVSEAEVAVRAELDGNELHVAVENIGEVPVKVVKCYFNGYEVESLSAELGPGESLEFTVALEPWALERAYRKFVVVEVEGADGLPAFAHAEVGR